MSTIQEQFIDDVLSRIPHGRRRDQIEMDLRAHIAERLELGQSIEQAIHQFGDPAVLADSYLSSTPLVSASFMARSAAKLIDVPVILAASCLMLWILWQLFGPADQPFFPQATNPQSFVFVWFCVVTFVCIVPGYFIAAEYMTDQTLGKKALGLIVVRESGARISFGQSFIRQLPLIGGFYLLDVLFALFTEKNQRAFELISKTRVVEAEPR
jgi:uncharacterized RDD family membrane protein YckC